MQAEQEPEQERAERLRQLREQVAGLERNRSRKLRRRQQQPPSCPDRRQQLDQDTAPPAGPILAGPNRPANEQSTNGDLVSTGCEALDRLLAPRGLERGSLVEWLSPGRGGAAGIMAWLVAREAARHGGGIVVVDRQRCFYPPAAVAWGVNPQSLAVVRVDRDEDELWAVDQALRSPAVAAVWLYRDELSTRDFRRWQLAAERGGTLGLLVRPASVLGQPTWADVRWKVRPVAGGTGTGQKTGPRGTPGRAWRLRVELARCRGGVAGQQVEVELDDVSGVLRVVGEDQTERFGRSCAGS